MADATPSDGRTYRIHDVLGTGGFGTVYRAELVASGGFSKPVALKLLNNEMTGSTEVVARLRDEARVLGLLRHRAIVTVDGLVKLDGRWAIVMEYVEGASLRALLKACKRVPVEVALEIVEEVASALHVAYDKPTRSGETLELLHRDIKPSNIQVSPMGEVKLLDFGVARARFDAREAETRSVVYGSLPYMAPERLEFEDSHRSDIFALGVTLVEAITGEALPGNPTAHPKKHAVRVEAARTAVGKWCEDAELLEFLTRMLAYEPLERPTAREVERQARAIRQRLPGKWLRDWAEENVDRAQGSQPRPSDALSGAVLSEHSGSLGAEPGSQTGDPDSTFAFTSGFDPPEASVVTAEPAPVAETVADEPLPPDDLASRVSPTRTPRKRRSGGGVRWFRTLLYGTLLVGLATLAALAALIATGTLGSALGLAVLWPALKAESYEQAIVSNEAMLSGVQPTPEREQARELMYEAAESAREGSWTFAEFAAFQQSFDRAVFDGVITPAEVIELEHALLLAADTGGPP